jgi:hypothetical protein
VGSGGEEGKEARGRGTREGERGGDYYEARFRISDHSLVDVELE